MMKVASSMIDKLSVTDNPDVKMTKMETGPLQSVFLCHDEKSQQTYGRGSCVVRTSLSEFVAYSFDLESAFFKSDLSTSMLKECILEKRSPHHLVFYCATKPVGLISSREFVWSIVWKRLSQDQFIYVAHPTLHDAAPVNPHFVRAESTRAMRLTKLSPRTIKLEMFFHMDFKGYVPMLLISTILLPASIIETQSRATRYFLQIKDPADFEVGEDNAATLAQILLDGVYTLQGEERTAALDLFFLRTAVLRAISSKHPWFQTLVYHLVANKLRPATKNATPLSLFTYADAEAVGKSFAVVLLSNVNAPAAFDEWALSYPSMGELSATAPMLRPFVTRIAKFLLLQTTWGMKLRVGTGGLLSVLDMIR